MKDRYVSRRAEPDDLEAINDLYFLITGHRRSPEAYRWQWTQSPVQTADMFVIEHTSPSSGTRIVGHHGIMPVPFTWGDRTFVFGKTENTFVHPEYRERILYTRFEQRFASEYAARYDALFSTFGPPDALRQRQALGYRQPQPWIETHLSHGALSWLGWRLRARTGVSWPVLPWRLRTQRRQGRVISAYVGAEAASDPFFADCWDCARLRYGISPRRDAVDLHWRFWTNPRVRYTTLVIDAGPCAGYVILRPRHTPYEAVIVEDAMAVAPDEAAFGGLFSATLDWVRASGHVGLSVQITGSGVAAPGLEAALRALVGSRAGSTVSLDASPRRLTARGEASGLRLEDWFLTGLVFEGR